MAMVRPGAGRHQKGEVEGHVLSHGSVSRPDKVAGSRPMEDKGPGRDRADQLRRAEQERWAEAIRMRDQQQEEARRQQEVDRQRRAKQMLMDRRDVDQRLDRIAPDFAA